MSTGTSASALRIAANFVSVYYKLFVSEPTSLSQLYTPGARLNQHRTADEINQYLQTLPKGQHRVTIAEIDDVKSSPGRVNFLVTGLVERIGGEPEYSFMHSFELREHAEGSGAFGIVVDNMRKDAPDNVSVPAGTAAMAGTAQNASTGVAPPRPVKTRCWADDTPPLYSKENPDVPPVLDVGPSMAPPVAAPPVVATPPSIAAVAEPAPPAAAPDADSPKPADKHKPDSTVATVVPDDSKPTTEISSAAAADDGALADASGSDAAAHAAPPPATKSFAEIMRRDAKPTSSGAKPSPDQRPTSTPPPEPVKAAKPPAATVDKVKPPVTATPPPPPAAKEVDPISASVVTDAKPVEVKPKAPAWGGQRTLNFSDASTAAPTASKPAVVVAPSSTVADKATKPAAPAPVKSVPTPTVAAAAPPPRGGPTPAITYHVFFKGLPEGATEDEVCELVKAFVTLRRPLKIERKIVQEDHGGTQVDKVRTFAFALLEAATDADVAKGKKAILGKTFKCRGAHVLVDDVREKAGYLPKK